MSTTKEIMTTKIITSRATDSIVVAYKIMIENNIRHLPVMDERNSIVGILSDRDVQRAMTVTRLNQIQQQVTLDANLLVEEFMSWPVYVVSETTSVKKIVQEMLSQKVSAFIVEDNSGRMKGIITTDDILKLFLMEEEEDRGPYLKAISHYFLDPERI